MTRRKTEALRPLTDSERQVLEQLSRSDREPAGQVAHAKGLLAVTAGKTYPEAAVVAGRQTGDTVARWVHEFNQRGLAALERRHGGGPARKYGPTACERILTEVRRPPSPEQDGPATWSLQLLCRSLRRAPDGLPTVSEDTIRTVLLEAGFTWQRARSWCQTGQVVRKRKSGVVTVVDPDAEAKKTLIEDAYLLGEKLGLAVWNQDEAGPYQTKPYPGASWQPSGQPVRQAHEYIRKGTAKMLTLFHPRSGAVRLKGVTSATNAVLHPWLKEQCMAILNTLPPPTSADAATQAALWQVWQQGLRQPSTLPTALPPLRMLLVWDNLAGHYTAEMGGWLIEHGIMPLYTPLGGSWLNMAESVQRIIVRRALDGQSPETPPQIIEALETTAKSWNREPTPFVWGGKRAARRQRSRERRHALGGSGACTQHSVRQRPGLLKKWLTTNQTTH